MLMHELSRQECVEWVTDWLRRFADACAAGDSGAAAHTFCADGYWRDVLALTENIHTYYGHEQIADALGAALAGSALSGIALEEQHDEFPRVATYAGRDVVEAIFHFRTRLGRGRGVVTLVSEDSHVRAATMLSALEQLDGRPELLGDNRPTGLNFSRTFHGPNWLDQRNRERLYEDRDPAVLVVGAGQAGLSVAARLKHLGVDTLVIDRNQRVGDNWRKRYHSLTLHNEVWANHLPYLPFPDGWPVYIPKDKLANWLETYVDILELNCWTGTELTQATFDEAAERWTVQLGQNGEGRVLRPRHIVIATGVSCKPKRPEFPGESEFIGRMLHTSEFDDGAAFAGERVLVVGSGTSGHDIAHELYEHQAEVTIAQRSSTTIVRTGRQHAGRVYKAYESPRPLADTDLLTTSVPFPVLRRNYQYLTRDLAELDRDLLDGLAASGFALDFGEDGTGFQMKYLQRGGGYYMDVGCSQLIADGKIGLLSWSEFERFNASGVVLRNGGRLSFDAVILATGYESQEALIESIMGTDVASRVGPIWGFDDEGELRNMWRPTPQPGLWFTAGSLAQARIYSKYLALQIAALEAGLIDVGHRDALPRGVIRDVDLEGSMVAVPVSA